MARIEGAANEHCWKWMEALCAFLDLEGITYVDHGDRGDDYILQRKDGSTFTLKARGNRDQGGFLSMDLGGPPVEGGLTL